MEVSQQQVLAPCETQPHSPWFTVVCLFYLLFIAGQTFPFCLVFPTCSLSLINAFTVGILIKQTKNWMKNIACGQGAAGLRCLGGQRPAGEACDVMVVGEMLRWEKRWCTSKAQDRAQVWQDWVCLPGVNCSIFTGFVWTTPHYVPAMGVVPVPAVARQMWENDDCVSPRGSCVTKRLAVLWRSLAGSQMLQVIAGQWLWLLGEGRQWLRSWNTPETCDRGASWNLWDSWHQPTWNKWIEQAV